MAAGFYFLQFLSL